MGDLNAKVGAGQEAGVVGGYGLGVRNQRGDRFVQFCIEKELNIMNTFFKLPKRRLYTWRSPADSPTQIIRNQIDYIAINQRYKNAIKSVKTYPGADVPSDHNLLVSELYVRFKKITRPRRQNKVDLNKLEDNKLKAEVTSMIEKDMEEVIQNQQQTSIDDQWNNFKKVTTNVMNTKLLQDVLPRKKKWMTEEILKLMDERRGEKNKNEEKYKQLHRELRRKIRQAKAEWFSQECAQVEELARKYDNFHLHKKLKEAAGTYKHSLVGKLVDENGDIILDIEGKLVRWKCYLEELFADERKEEHGIGSALSGAPITEAEVLNAIASAKARKATGPDEIPAEILKVLGDGALKFVTRLFNGIYDTGVIPKDWLKSTFIAVPKKPNASECKDHRTISLMSHVLKIFLRVIHQRIYRKMEQHIGETQFGFRNSMGTREALFSIQVLVQRCRDVNCNVFLCFIDFEKAFDKVQHDKMIKVLKNTGIDDKDIRFIANLYWNQTANMKVENQTTEDIIIKRGVRQGCILSPLIFNIYSEEIFKEALSEADEGIKINGVVCNNVRYADDTVLIADSLNDLQLLLNNVIEACSKYGLTINARKTKYMIVSKQGTVDTGLIVNDVQLEKTDKMTYLGCQLKDDWDHSYEIKCRIEKARAAFVRLRKVLCGHDLDLHLRMRMVRCYVFSVLLYGVETWTLTEAALKRLEAFEMWVYRRMLKISWTEHVTNVIVLQKMRKEKEIIKAVKARKLEYFGHIMRHPDKYELLQRILQGKIQGRRSPGRRRISWMKNLRQWFGKSTTALFREAVGKVIIANMIANIR